MECVQPIRDREQIETMKDLLGKNKRDYLLFVLGINSGLRIGDILNLKVSDVTDKRGRIVSQFELKEEKTGKKKLIIFSEAVRRAIKEYLDDSRLLDEDDGPLFVSQKRDQNGNLKPISRQQAWNILNKAARRIGIEDNIGTHSMRKTFGYHAYHAGVRLEYLQKIFNHADGRITLDYIGITQDAISDVQRQFSL